MSRAAAVRAERAEFEAGEAVPASGATPPYAHATVLRDEVVAALAEVPSGWVVDCTLGGGGHSEALLRARPDVRLLGLDRDADALLAAQARLVGFGERFLCAHAPFADVDRVLDRLGIREVAGFIADLGVSSPQLDRADRGFSFRSDGPLDMRMDPSRGEPLRERLLRVRQEDLAVVLREYGDVDRPGRAARVCCEAAAEGVDSTVELAARISRVLPGPSKIHPATRVFQALRIWVNDEIEQLERLLAVAPPRLLPGGVMAVISFHSGEDRVVKHTFRALAPRHGEFELPVRKSIEADVVEVSVNPRARSARLRLLRRPLADAFDAVADAGDDGDEGPAFDLDEEGGR